MDLKKFLTLALAVALALTLACGGGGGGDDDYSDDGAGVATPSTGGSDTGTAAPAAAPAAAPTGPMGKVSGVIKFEGEVKKGKRIRMGADKACSAMHSEDVLSDQVVVSDDGGLANVFLYLKDYTGTGPVPAEPAVLDQVGCMYLPHVIGVVAGQTLNIKNSDATLHNIHPQPKDNDEFNLAMPTEGMVIPQTFEKPEMAIKFKCDVHPWMAAYCHVMAHPYFAVSGADGTFEMSVPPGTYQVEAWHEKFPSQSGSVTVEENGTATLDLTFKAS